jgi:hypothetical protein
MMMMTFVHRIACCFLILAGAAIALDNDIIAKADTTRQHFLRMFIV